MAGGRAASTPVSQLVVVAVLFMGCFCGSTSAFNITEILKSFPDYTQFNDWLSTTGVAEEINNRSTLTVLAPSNTVLAGYLSGVPNAWTDPDKVGDTLRYHVLLGFFGIPQLQQLPGNGTSVTTLLQTTGRANQSQGFVTLYNNGTSFLVGHEFLDDYGNETILGNVTEMSYQYVVLAVSSLLSPAPPTLPSPAPAPSPLGGKAPTPAPPGVADTPAVTARASPQDDDNHASGKRASKLLVLLAMLLASVVTTLI